MSSSITTQQRERLEGFFSSFPNPNESQLHAFADSVGLDYEEVEMWFENKRATTQIESDEEADSYEAERGKMLKIAKGASDELFHLMYTMPDQNTWIYSLKDGRLWLNRATYQRKFPKDTDPNIYKTAHTRVESSADHLTVSFSARQLVETLLNAEVMLSCFPTMIQKAEIIKQYDHGSDQTRNGALQLMYLEMQSLSPLVSARQYMFLRYCKEVVDAGGNAWLITDVSVDYPRDNLPSFLSWKRPSGFMIRQLPHANSCTVTWIEHVEANDRPERSLLYQQLVVNNVPYSAVRWVSVLQRNIEKFNRFNLLDPEKEADQPAIPIDVRRNLLELSMRMARSLNGNLNKSGSMVEMEEYCESNANKNEVVKFFSRENSGPGHPLGTIVTAVTSFWFPLKPRHVFTFLTDVTKRAQWDFLCKEHVLFEVAKVPTGNDPTNCLSIFQKHSTARINLNEPDKTMMIFQESFQENVASYIVFAPIDLEKMQPLITGRKESSSNLPILPCGFVITGDIDAFTEVMNERTYRRINSPQGGTLLTVAYQIHVCNTQSITELKVKSMPDAKTLFRDIVDNIKGALMSELKKNSD